MQPQQSDAGHQPGDEVYFRFSYYGGRSRGVVVARTEEPRRYVVHWDLSARPCDYLYTERELSPTGFRRSDGG